MSVGDIFLKVLNMSITAGWFLLAVLGIRLIFRRMPRWTICFLWGAAAIRLICPFFVESRFSILPGMEPIKTSAVVEGEVQNYIPSIDMHLSIVENTINPILTESFAYNESESAAPLQIVTYVAGMAWACGMILLTICAVISMIKLHRLVREAICVKDNIHICDAVKSPFILGMIRPRVYLSSALNEKETDYILAHEAAHLARKDHWWKLLGYLLLCIHWFNPLCWAAYATFCKDIELACDERVIRSMTIHEKKEYSKVLLSCTRQRSLIMVCPLAFGEVGIKERVKAILNYKKPTLWIMITAVAVFAISAICFLTDPIDESKDTALVVDHVEAGIVSRGGEDESSQSLGEAPEGETSAQEGKAEGISFSPDLYGRHRAQTEAGLEESVALQTEETTIGKDAVYNVTLYEQPEADKVCIEVQPSMIREYHSYYYVPTGEDQRWLAGQIEALDLEGEPSDKRWEGHKETGWQIIYNDIEMRGFEGGYLYYTYYDEEKGMMEALVEAPKLCDYIQIMLIEKTGFQNYDASEIKDIVSATLNVNSILTDWQLYGQTITDAETLNKLEDWFSNATYILGGADCGNQCACLELTLANGDVVKLSIATDSCSNFCIDGVAYDYRPEPNWDNGEFFNCFNEIPWISKE